MLFFSYKTIYVYDHMPLAGCIFDQLCLTMLKSAHKIWLCTELPHLLWKNKKTQKRFRSVICSLIQLWSSNDKCTLEESWGLKITSVGWKSYEGWNDKCWLEELWGAQKTSAHSKSHHYLCLVQTRVHCGDAGDRGSRAH